MHDFDFIVNLRLFHKLQGISHDLQGIYMCSDSATGQSPILQIKATAVSSVQLQAGGPTLILHGLSRKLY